MKKKTSTLDRVKEGLGRLFKDKKLKILVIVGIAGVLLIFVGDLFSGTTQSQSSQMSTMDDNTYNEQYVARMQTDLTDLLSRIEGIGEVQVLVTLETGVQYVYATNEKVSGDSSTNSSNVSSQKSSSESTVILVETVNGKEPLVLKRIEPTILGVVVVCQGADNIYVKQMVVEAVSTLCGIGTNRVSVAKMS